MHARSVRADTRAKRGGWCKALGVDDWARCQAFSNRFECRPSASGAHALWQVSVSRREERAMAVPLETNNGTHFVLTLHAPLMIRRNSINTIAGIGSPSQISDRL